MIEFKKVKSEYYHSDYHILQDDNFVGYTYRKTRSCSYIVVMYDGLYRTEHKNIQPVKSFVKGLLQCMN